jgi:hypothetical protein
MFAGSIPEKAIGLLNSPKTGLATVTKLTRLPASKTPGSDFQHTRENIFQYPLTSRKIKKKISVHPGATHGY